MPSLEELRKKFDARAVAKQEALVRQEQAAQEAEFRKQLLDYQASAVRPEMGGVFAYLARGVRLGISDRKICIVSHREVDATLKSSGWTVLANDINDENVEPFNVRKGKWSSLGSFTSWEDAVARVESELTSPKLMGHRIEVFPKCTPPFDPSRP